MGIKANDNIRYFKLQKANTSDNIPIFLYA